MWGKIIRFFECFFKCLRKNNKESYDEEVININITNNQENIEEKKE